MALYSIICGRPDVVLDLFKSLGSSDILKGLFWRKRHLKHGKFGGDKVPGPDCFSLAF